MNESIKPVPPTMPRGEVRFTCQPVLSERDIVRIVNDAKRREGNDHAS